MNGPKTGAEDRFTQSDICCQSLHLDSEKLMLETREPNLKFTSDKTLPKKCWIPKIELEPFKET